MAVQPRDIRLLKNPPFRRLLESRVIGQTAQNAMLYALLILVVEETGSSVQSTILIMAFTIPTVVLGIPAGTIADVLPKRFTLTVSNLVRAAIVGAMIYYRHHVWSIYLLAAVFSSVGQLFSPAESAAVPAVVRQEQLPAANSLMVFTLMLGQVAGMVMLAPFLLKVLGTVAVFTVSSLLFLAAAWVISAMRLGVSAPEQPGVSPPGFVDAMLEGFRILRTNRRAYLAMTYLTIAMTLSKVVVVLLPQYTHDVLRISTENVVFVAAPAAIGAGAGLLLAPFLARLIGSWRVVAFGFALFLLGLVGLGSIVYVRDFFETHVNLGISFVEERVGVSSVITMTMILAIPLGLAFALVSVAGRVVLNEEAPQQVQGRVFAFQGALADTISLLPLLIVGAVADLVGVRATLLASAASALAVGAYLTFSRRFGPPPLPARRPAEAG